MGKRKGDVEEQGLIWVCVNGIECTQKVVDFCLPASSGQTVCIS